MARIYKKTLITVVTLITAATTAEAQIPEGYYASLEGKKGADLKTAVHEIIKTATVLSYGSGAGHTWDGFYTTDRTDDGMVIDRYSNDERYFGSKGAAVSGMNIEHSFPKSWWGGSQNQAYKDLYNLMPCEQKINSSKSNYPMGEVTTVKTDNGCTRIGTGYGGYQLWEPADKWKGDFARGYMYMATAYQDLTWSGTQALQILVQGDWPTLQEWAYTLYMKWARADEVDRQEVERNNAVSSIQGNRNPFVDFPNLMEYIWGDSTDYAFNTTTTFCTGSYVSGGDDPEPQPTETVVYEADFTASDGGCTIKNTTVPADGFTVWNTDSRFGWKGTAYVNYTNHAADATLMTPEIDLSEYDGATLWFEHAVNYCAYPEETMAVEIICDGQTTTLSGITWPAGNTWTFKESGYIAIDGFAGKKIKVAFHYRSTDTEAGTWEIKRMSVTGTSDPSGIRLPDAGSDGPDLTQPYETYTMDGRRTDVTGNRVVIIRQNGRTWKMKGGQ